MSFNAEQQQQFDALKRFYAERGVNKTDADVAKTIHKFSNPEWTNPATNEVELTGGYENMWTILNVKYPNLASTPAPQQHHQIVHTAESSRQIPVHTAIGYAKAQSVQVAAPVVHSTPAPVQRDVVVAAPVMNTSHAVHTAIGVSPVSSPRTVNLGASAAPPVFVYAQGQSNNIVEVPNQGFSAPYPQPAQIISGYQMQEIPGFGSQRNVEVQQETVTETVKEKKTRTLSPEAKRMAASFKRSEFQDRGHHSPVNVNSTVRQLALADMAGPRGYVNQMPGQSSSSKKASKGYYKLVASTGSRSAGGSAMQASSAFKAHHLAENEAMGLTSLGASRRAAPGGGGGGMSASQKAQMGGVRIPTGPSILRDELHKEDGVLNEYRGLDDHRMGTREETASFRGREWINKAR